MATIFRGPNYVSRSEIAPVLRITAFAVPSLLVTVLAAGPIPMPMRAAHSFPLQSISQPPYLNADTSRGSFKPLLKELVLPRGTVAPHFAPAPHQPLEWLNASTAAGTPKTLRAELVLPKNTAPWFGPSAQPIALWLPANTTAGMASSQRVVFVQPPLTGPPQFVPLRVNWQPADTTQGIPGTLRVGVVQPPLNVAPWSKRAAQPLENWLPADTSQGMPVALRPPQAIVQVRGPTFATVQFGWQQQDTTRSQPATLKIVVAQPPFVGANLQQTTLDALRSVTDTSLRQPITLQAAIPPPPFVVAPSFAPVRVWWKQADTSTGTAKTLYGDQIPPRVNLPYPLADISRSGLRQVADTSRCAYGTTYPFVVVPLPPGNVQFVAPPQYAWQTGDTTLESPPVAIQGVQPVVVVVTPPLQGGARPPWGGTKKKRHYVRIGNKEYIVASERDVEYLLSRELSKPEPIVPAKVKGKPIKVRAPETFEVKPLNPVNVAIALKQLDEDLRAKLKQMADEQDEEDIEMILLAML